MNIDDLILSNYINEEELLPILQSFEENHYDYLKLINIGNEHKKEAFIKTKSDAPYRTSTIFSVWKKDVLLDILKV